MATRDEVREGIQRVLTLADGEDIAPSARALTRALVNVVQLALDWQDRIILTPHEAARELMTAITEGLDDGHPEEAG